MVPFPVCGNDAGQGASGRKAFSLPATPAPGFPCAQPSQGLHRIRLGRIFPAARSLGRRRHSSCATGFHMRLQSLLLNPTCPQAPLYRAPRASGDQGSPYVCLSSGGAIPTAPSAFTGAPATPSFASSMPAATSLFGTKSLRPTKAAYCAAFRLAGPPELRHRFSHGPAIPSFASGTLAAPPCPGSGASGRDKVSPCAHLPSGEAIRSVPPAFICAQAVPSFASGAPAAASLSGSRSLGPTEARSLPRTLRLAGHPNCTAGVPSYATSLPRPTPRQPGGRLRPAPVAQRKPRLCLAKPGRAPHLGGAVCLTCGMAMR